MQTNKMPAPVRRSAGSSWLYMWPASVSPLVSASSSESVVVVDLLFATGAGPLILQYTSYDTEEKDGGLGVRLGCPRSAVRHSICLPHKVAQLVSSNNNTRQGQGILRASRRSAEAEICAA
mmetsp:Transcript_36996/g.92779  ORF Transcript_36996/g.92779 Transcript_36996/m.92779 type:complete len:121 (-) Transcript_36996:97-459(-)